MKTKTDLSQQGLNMPRIIAPLSCALAVCLVIAACPAQAQDGAAAQAPAAPAEEQNEFDAMRAATGQTAADQTAGVTDPIAALNTNPVGTDVTITNQPQDQAAAPAEISPVQDASGEQAPEMPAAVAQDQPVAQTETAPTDTAADPMAPYRAQEQIKAAQQNAAQQAQQAAQTNPLGPAGQLPLTNRVTQSQEELQAQLDADAAAQQERIKQQVFDSSLESLLPLSPDQTRDVLDTFRKSREAAETPIAVPKARTTVENVSLDPSQPPLSIKTSPGYVTTLTILDMTGAPWAIQDVSWAGKFEVTTPEEGGHVIRITPMSAHGVGNISIRLVDLITPITFSIDTGLDVVDYRFDARIPKPGPLAKTPLVANGGLTTVAGTDENLMRVLDGTAVSNATRVMLDGVDGATSAYTIDDTMYLRTPLTLLSPSWQSSATSADGMNVYTLKTAPVILLSDKGRMVKARIKAPE